MRYEYSMQYDPAKSARSQAFDADVSYKDLTQVCDAIRGRPIPQARKFLENAVALKHAIAYRRHSRGIGHRSELGGRQGRYPKKAAKFTLEILENAFANSQTKGLDEKTLVVLAACAYKQNVYPRYRKYFASGNVLGYGKHASMANYMTARLEIVVGQNGIKPIKPPTKKQAKVIAKKKPALVKKEEKPAAAKAPAAKPAVEAAKKPEAAKEAQPQVAVKQPEKQ